MSAPNNQGPYRPQNTTYKQQHPDYQIHGNFPGILPMPAPQQKPIDIHRVKRTRAKRSCDMCRKKKTRCDVDVNKPCTTCRTAKTECQFVIEQKKRGPATGSYVEALESRLKRMEAMLENMASLKQADSASVSPKPSQANSPNNTPSPVDTGSPVDRASSVDRGSPLNRPSTIDREPIHKSSSILNLAPLNEDTPSRVFNPGDNSDMIHILLGRNIQSSHNVDSLGPQISADLSEHLNALTITDYDRTRYIGSSSGLHMLNQELLQSNKRHRLVDHPSWIVQKLNDDVDEHVIMKTEEIDKSRIHDRLPLVVERFSFFDDIPNMTQELADAMVHHYFTYVHSYCPILNKIGFLEQYYYHNPSPPDEFLLYAICSIGARFVNFESHSDLRSYCNITTEDLLVLQATLLSRSRDILKIIYKRSRIGSVQTLILLTMFVEDSEDDSEDTSHWFITGMAIRMAQDLGLHRNSGKWQIPEHEIELRRRIWFATYVMDRWVGAEIGRPVSILDHEFDVELPSPYEINTTHRTHVSHINSMEYKPTLISEAEKAIKERKMVYEPFLHAVTLSQILGQILVGLYSPKAKHAGRRNASLVSFLDSNLKSWKLNLPPSIKIDYSVGEPFNVVTGMLNMCYNCVIILLHRPFIVKDENESMTSAFHSLSTCTAAATNLLDVVEQMEMETFQSIPWSIALYSIFQSAIIFLHNSKGDNPYVSLEGIRNLRRCSGLFQRDIHISSTRIAKVLSSLVANFSAYTDEEMTEVDPNADNKSQNQLVVSNRYKNTFPRKRDSSSQLDNQEGSLKDTSQSRTFGGNESSNSSETQSQESFSESSPEPVAKHARQDTGDSYRYSQSSSGGNRLDPMGFSSKNYPPSGPNPSLVNPQFPSNPLDAQPEDMFLTSLSLSLGKNIVPQPREQDTAHMPFPSNEPNRTPLPTHPDCPRPVDQAQFFQCPEDAYYTSQLLGHQLNNQTLPPPQNSNPEGPIPTPSASYPFLTSMMTDMQDTQFDANCLNSQVPLWDMPSGATWDEWDSFLKSNIHGFKRM
ncbi:fungal-specific transcription factor domain-containing protein [Phycomyces nitens]|nr:fungal-specific transcription factor domain-containing protein [Phycomyces nitens]